MHDLTYLFESPKGRRTRWASFENPSAARGAGGATNRGAKGRAFLPLLAGETATLLDFAGSGVIHRIWCTVSDRSPEMLRGLRLRMWWDDAQTPAVDCPLGDFFGIGLGRRTPFSCALFSDPEGRSFNGFVPMPFRSRARITLTNETETDLSHLFYDVNLTDSFEHAPDTLHFHAVYRRENPNALGADYTILPEVSGTGRFLGANLGVVADERYGDTWWGEGEVKVYFAGDELPTLCGTGTEDYIGTAWGQGAYAHPTQGCPIADSANRQWAFYRYHIDDPVYFDGSIRVTIQTIGGGPKSAVERLRDSGAPLIPVTVDSGPNGFHRLRDNPEIAALPDGWCNFWRRDDWSSVAYFYLDRPESSAGDSP